VTRASARGTQPLERRDSPENPFQTDRRITGNKIKEMGGKQGLTK
jgi:hypothetical protein